MLLSSASFGVTLKVKVSSITSQSFPQSNSEYIEITSSKSLSNEKEHSPIGLISPNKKKHFSFKNSLGIKDQPSKVLLSQMKETLAILLDKNVSEIPINTEETWMASTSLIVLGDHLEDFLITEGFEVTHREENEKHILLPDNRHTYKLLLYLKKQ